jgi:protein SCO1/2
MMDQLRQGHGACGVQLQEAGMRALAVAAIGVGIAGVVSIAALRPFVSSPPSAVPSNALLDQRGEPFAMAQLRGKSVVLNFMFTHCPGICPLQTQALLRVRARLPEAVRERVHFVSVTVDPEHDSPGVLAAFAAKQGVSGEGWTFVTGPAPRLAALGDDYSVRALPAGAGPLDHRTEVRLINARGELMQTYTGNPLDEPRLAREIQTVDELFAPTASR